VCYGLKRKKEVMKKIHLWGFFVLFMFFFVFPERLEAALVCCCGWSGEEKPATVADCKTELSCVGADESLCQGIYTSRLVGTVPDIGSDGDCLKEETDLTNSMCTTETSGLLANTSPGCVSQGDCTVCDFIKVFSNVARLILGIAGAFALLLFIYGGFTWIISQGNTEKIEAGKKIITGTLIGLLIVLGSWQITRIILITLLVSEKQATEQEKKLRTDILKVFTDPTYNPCTDPSFGTK